MNDPNQTVDEPGRETGSPVSAASAPTHVGRYRIEKVLGRGGFGLVYLAYDDQLQRLVAIKVPHRKLVDRPEAAEAYLTEARTVANLDHPHIVPVFDVGSTNEFACYVVSKYVDGTDLATRLKKSRLLIHETVELVATVAEALHHAHKQGLVHRDIKPGNILLDGSGKPFVADFGLALREQDIGKGPRYAGTPAYTSPEQARGEGHRVDGRSDIFSLGVVFYELLTGRRPFRAVSLDELLDQITSLEPRPIRQIEDTIPKELERICLKSLSKRASERFTTARDMAEDLRHFLRAASVAEKSTLTGREKGESELDTPVPTVTTPPGSDSLPLKIVPKGLRSFEATDADFFLELLPCPRDRDGLPDSIRFWKTRIEATEADCTFSMGLIYGPSGCGKSSLMRAGLLPRLAKSVTAVYVEATSQETEARLLKGLQRQLPDLPSNLGFVEALAALRRGSHLEPGQKVLLVLDQFEQWLHAKRSEDSTEMVQALRQCDGGRLQAMVMVRDDFWLAVSRFMRAMEVEILEGRNSALVDLFDLLHARKVLAAFGRAYGRLPDKLSQCSKDQDAFLDQAVAGLAQDGKVISVRLALFAEMVKGKPWTPATLKEVGGAEGVGATFLEETFTASAAPPQHRLHQKAAQAVLKSLLPEAGTDIKGHTRSQRELLAASGYASRPRDFEELLRILDSEIRLITPTDPEGVEGGARSVQGEIAGAFAKSLSSPSTLHASPSTRFYQLTHDFLVRSLREWLTRKQKETRRGRVELLLADRAAVWNARPENRQLPSLLQWFQINWLTAKENWTPPQRKMMTKGGRYHAVRVALVALLLAAGALTGLGIRARALELQQITEADGLVKSLLKADIAQVPGIIDQLTGFRDVAAAPLRNAHARARADGDAAQQLRVGLVLLPEDPGQFEGLYQRLFDPNTNPEELRVIRDALKRAQEAELVKRLKAVLASGKEDPERRLRAGCALAGCATTPDEEEKICWQAGAATVVRQLLSVVQKNPSHYDPLRKLLHSRADGLRGELTRVYHNRARSDSERSFAASFLAEYAAAEPEFLAELLVEADARQFAVVYARLKDHGERATVPLRGELLKKPAAAASVDARNALAKRQANAGVALLRLGQAGAVWPLLQPSPDPTMRSELIHRFRPLGAEPTDLMKRVREETDGGIRQALLLSLGEYAVDELPVGDKAGWISEIVQIYQDSTDAGLHGAAEWLLRTWKQESTLKLVNGEWAKDKVKGEGWWVVGKDKGSPPATHHPSPPSGT